MWQALRKLWQRAEQGERVAVERPAGVSRRDFLRQMGVTSVTVAVGGMAGSLWQPERKLLIRDPWMDQEMLKQAALSAKHSGGVVGSIGAWEDLTPRLTLGLQPEIAAAEAAGAHAYETFSQRAYQMLYGQGKQMLNYLAGRESPEVLDRMDVTLVSEFIKREPRLQKPVPEIEFMTTVNADAIFERYIALGRKADEQSPEQPLSQTQKSARVIAGLIAENGRQDQPEALPNLAVDRDTMYKFVGRAHELHYGVKPTPQG